MAAYSYTSKVQWHEGMLLMPQHFQYTEQRFESLLSVQSQFQAYTAWGVMNYAFDETLLNQGVFALSELFTIFPDGTVIKLSNEDGALECNLKELNLKSTGDVNIFLCLSSEPINKYISKVYKNVTDDNSPDNAVDMPVLQPKVFLNPNQCPEGCVGFIIAKITFDNKRFFAKPYMPPCINVAATYPPFIKQLANIVLNLRQKATFLVNKNQSSTSAVLSRDTQDILKPVISSLCVLEPLLGLTKIHPERFFEQLNQVTSLIMPLTNQVPGVLPSYDPYDPYESLSFYLNNLEKVVATIQQRYVSISFHQQDRLFYLHMHPEFLNNADQLYLGIRSPQGMNEYQLQQWVEEAVFACDDKIELVTTRRITGAVRTLLQIEDVADIIPHPGTQLYQVSTRDEYVRSKQNLNIFNPGDSAAKRPLDITLYLKQAET